VGFLLVPGFALMSYAAAIEPLRAANLLSGRELYRWWHAAPGGKPVAASNGVAIIPDCGTNTEREADLVFVCAGGNPATFADKSTFAWLRRLARKGVTIGGISGGPYVLAKAGLLDERRATLCLPELERHVEPELAPPPRGEKVKPVRAEIREARGPFHQPVDLAPEHRLGLAGTAGQGASSAGNELEDGGARHQYNPKVPSRRSRRAPPRRRTPSRH